MARTHKPASYDTPVSAVRHVREQRPNIPTAELESFAADNERQPAVVRYPRDPSLDPQLVWKGKDEQDAHDLEVPAVPIYIQEQIAPQALIEDLRAASQAGARERQLDLFNDFDGLEFEQRVEFYEHSQRWTNRLILGDSLLVMTSLAEKEGLKGKVQMIYMDPPYGIKFGSNWQVSTRRRDVNDGKADDATRQPEQIKAFRDTWELGIHSYLSYLRDRFAVARDLLTESGSIFVQIGDENVHLVRSVLDEIFGSAHHVVTLIIKKTGSQKSNLIDPVNDYVLWYSKASRDGSEHDRIKFHQIFVTRDLDASALAEFDQVELPDGRHYQIGEVPTPDGGVSDYRLRPQQLFQDYPAARLFACWPITNGGYRRNQSVPFIFDGVTYNPPSGQCWRHTAQTDDGSMPGMNRLAAAGRIVQRGRGLTYKRYFDDFPYKTVTNVWDGIGGAGSPIYVVQTNTEIVQRCILMTTDPGDLVLDPTCGSGTTAYVAEQWGRRWITIDTSRVALALARTRLMAGRYPYYLLADSPEGAARQAHQGSGPPRTGPFTGDIRQGFVYRTVAHISSSTIANNPDIQEGMSRAEIDAAIARHAETEVLYDRPYTDPKVVRVSGPFTVESLSPHRMLAADAGDGTRDGATPEVARDEGRFVSEIIDNLRKAGVQNTIKQERLQFDLLEPWPGEYVQARGEYTENGQPRTAAVCIGPEHGTVGQELVQAAAKEAVRMADLLVVCGFAFDAYARQTTHLGRLAILTAQMNPDLMMPELLKKTGAGNLFMVFGEPDIVIHHGADDLLTVEIRGLDVYDPTTGQIRSHSTDDIACWFIDTAYDEESFFVRHAYFLGAGDPYERLRRALRADVDEAAWASLYSATSRPFPRPDTGQIAVKVINHYGDEVLKVYKV